MNRLTFTAIIIAASFLAGNALSAPRDEEPQPPIVTPPTNGSAPSDAVVLFDGKDMSGFADLKGQPITWKVADGVTTAGKGDAVSKHTFADAQIHLEFNLPVSGKGHGNSGVYLHGRYEIQVIDSFNENPYKPGQQCAGIYMKYTPLVNATAAPGKWQTYDIIFHGAKGDKPARITVFHNGVLVQYNRSVKGGTAGAKVKTVDGKGPILLQSHGGPVQYRNIWARPIAPMSEKTGPPVNATNLKEHSPRVTPGTASTNDKPGAKPGDATYLFDGKDASVWMQKNKDEAIKWKVENGYMEVTRTGGINSKIKFSDIQLHVEFATPSEVKGDSQGRGNSGIKLHGKYEVQVLDSYNNKTYPNGQASAIYGQYAPAVNASRPPGRWQTYDVVYRTAKFDDEGKQTDSGGFTVLHNGVVVQDHVINKRAPKKGSKDKPIIGHLHLQDHGNPVRYRNIWFRPLK